MAWPSWNTSQLTAGYQQQNQMMGMMVPGSQLAENLTGGVMSRGMGMAGPVMGGMQAMMGLDPLSMGFRAASGVWGMGGGVMGAGMVGMGVAGGVAAAGMGAAYMGGQVMQGAQNQMAFNNSMRQNFNFMRHDGTGQGFNRSDLTAISGTLQSMTNSYGPGGETAGFGELTRLASNMGRMGMTTGVRDAQEFSKKFKEMVSTLKTVATELGTSLEAAQELLSSARGSGIFKPQDQLKFSHTMRTTGLAGGLATSEMTAMANIGSRISRQFGGLGRAGAMGGIKALGQVGIAEQIGAVTEEDIYNATGATGAEGRQAYAAEMMQSTGSFLRTGKGRYFLASVAGKDGKLNMDAANEYMYGGGMGTGRTKQLAHENLHGIGRANFIRNEGHLRGAVMEKFGTMAPAMALMGWARDRGININDMDDKSMLLAQRQLGWGREQVDQAVQMAEKMPDIMREERNVSRQDEYTQGKAQYNKGRELRTKLEHIRHGVQEKLQAVGQDLFQSGSEMIESTLNRIVGQFETYATSNINEIGLNARAGGAGNMRKFEQTFEAPRAGTLGMNSDTIRRLTANTLSRGYEKTGIINKSPYGGIGGYTSQKEQDQGFGDLFGSKSRDERAEDAGLGANTWALGVGIGSTLGNYAVTFGRMARYAVSGKGPGARDFEKTQDEIEESRMNYLANSTKAGGFREQVGKAFRDPVSGALIRSMATGKDAGAGLDRIKTLEGVKERSPEESGELLALKATDYGMQYRNLKPGDKAGMQALLNKVGNDTSILQAMDMGKTVDEDTLKAMASGVVGAMGAQAAINRNKWIEQRGVSARAEIEAGKKAGTLTIDKGGKAVLKSTPLDDKTRDKMTPAQKKAYALESDADRLGVSLLNKNARLAELAAKDDPTSSSMTVERLEMQQLWKEIHGVRDEGGIIGNTTVGEEEQLQNAVAHMTLSQKRAYAKKNAGTERGDIALDEIGYQQKFEGLNKATKGNVGATAARFLGINQGKEFESTLQGKSPEEVSRILSKAAGAKGKDAEAFEVDLQEALKAAKDPKRSDAGSLFSKAYAGASKEVQDNIKRGNAEEKDVLGADIAKNTKEANKYLEAIARGNDASKGILQGILDSEKAGSPDGFIGPPRAP